MSSVLWGVLYAGLLWSGAAGAASLELNPGDDVRSLTASLLAGDEIVLNAGVYPIAEPLDWVGIGTADAPIRIRSEGGPAILELQAGWTVAHLHDSAFFGIEGITFRVSDALIEAGADQPVGLYVQNVTDLTVTGCSFGPVWRTAVDLEGNNDRIAFTENEITGTIDGYGMEIGCRDVSCWTQNSTFSNNWIHDIGGEGSYLLYLADGGQGNTISDNVMYGTAYRGMSVGSTEYGPQNIVEGNAIWSTGEYGLLVRGAAIVRNNIVFDVDGCGIYSAENDRGTLANAVISHNTVYGTGGWAACVRDWVGKEGMVLANNAFYNTLGYGLQFQEGGLDDMALVTHNVVSGLVEGLELYTADALPVIAGGGERDMLDPEGWNYYPSSGSALINAALPDAAAFVPETDFNGAPRDGDAPDAGAYERSGEGNPGWVLQEGFKEAGYADDTYEVGSGCCGKEGSKDSGAGAAAFLGLAGAMRLRRRQNLRDRSA